MNPVPWRPAPIRGTLRRGWRWWASPRGRIRLERLVPGAEGRRQRMSSYGTSLSSPLVILWYGFRDDRDLIPLKVALLTVLFLLAALLEVPW